MKFASKLFNGMAAVAMAASACVAYASTPGDAPVASSPMDSPYLQPGCHPKAQVAQALQAAGQVPLITAYRGIPSRPKNYFSANADLSAGFQFEETATELCVRAEYRDIRLNNDPNVAIPTWAPLRGENQSFNQALERQRVEQGARVIFGAVAVDAQDRPTSRVVVTMGRGDEFTINRGVTYAGFPDGRGSAVMTLADISIDRNFTALASNDQNHNGRVVAVAMLGARP